MADETRPIGTCTSRRPSRTRTPRGPSRWTVRTRVLSTLLVFIAGGLAVTGVLTFAAQFRALDQRVEAELWQEHSELSLIANSTDADGETIHTTVDSVLVNATDSAAPSDHESVIALIDGEKRYQPRQQDFARCPSRPRTPRTPRPRRSRPSPRWFWPRSSTRRCRTGP
ncbi:hypothetical protein [Brachybacterium sp. GPGPB12]|uniref:hypothetical protein n=1 Tax=Brachybacterium sp. GPGPB12 TaxID=3023517 RepID=UPI003134634C